MFSGSREDNESSSKRQRKRTPLPRPHPPEKNLQKTRQFHHDQEKPGHPGPRPGSDLQLQAHGRGQEISTFRPRGHFQSSRVCR